jgi:hypothetical protein
LTSLSLKPIPASWAKLLGPLGRMITGIPLWLTLPQVESAAARARELQELVGEQFVVTYVPDAAFVDGDDDPDASSFGHLFSITAGPGSDLTEGTLDDRQDLESQLHAWLLASAAAFQAAADRVAARRNG